MKIVRRSRNTDAQAAERVSVHHGPTPLPSMRDGGSTSILQLHPNEQAYQPGRHRKRTRSSAGLDKIICGSSTARSPSLSSSSTEHSTGSGNGESEYDDAIKAKKVRGRLDDNSAGESIVTTLTDASRRVSTRRYSTVVRSGL